MPSTYLLIPGAWMGDLIWGRLITELTALDCIVRSLRLGGLEGSSDSVDVGLESHVMEVIDFIESERLNKVVLVGHSYSGFVTSLVANIIPERISSLIFIESFLPIDGLSLLEAAELDVESEIQSINSYRGFWQPPTWEELQHQPYLSKGMLDFLTENMVGHPGKTVTDKAKISFSNLENIPAFYIGGNLSDSIKNNQNFPHIQFYQLNGGHWPMLTMPKKLADIMINME